MVGIINTATSGTVWSVWTTTPTTTSTLIDVWPMWTRGTTSATTAVSNQITVVTGNDTWGYWCEGTPVHLEPRSPQQTEAMQRAAAESTARLLEAERKRAEAEARAEQLLIENLSLVQRLEYAQTRSFVVDGHAGRRFRIRHGRSGNVDLVGPDGRISERLCAHPNEMVPNADTMLAQKLMLDSDEALFLRVANRHAIHDQAPVLPALH